MISNYMKHRMALKNGQVSKPEKEKKAIPVISEKKKAADKAAKPQKELQDDWYERKVNELTDVCLECSGPTRSAIFVMAKESVAHILAKRKSMFPSVATHENNHLELCADCHRKFDNSWEAASTMKCWPVAVERFKIIYPSIAPQERRNIPDVLLQEVEL